METKKRGWRGLHQHPTSPFWCFAYKAPDGVWRHHSTKCTEIRKTNDAKRDFLGELKNSLLPSNQGEWTVSLAADEFKRHAKEVRKLAHRTLVHDAASLKPVIEHFRRKETERDHAVGHRQLSRIACGDGE